MAERQVILYLAESLDGFIAEKDGGTGFLSKFDSSAQDAAYQDFYSSIDTVLMGRMTYQRKLHLAGTYPYSDKESYVFSTTLHDTDDPTTVVAGNIPQFVRQLKGKKGKGIWLVGGADIFTDLLKEKLIDKLIITIAPVLLGDGVSLVASNLTDIPLKLLNAKQNDQFVTLTYEVLK
ncbi:dihydrofolate reductase family protein [Lacticaseibacillus mingshuiensis]|uniref:dihydrofolate reductase family protein n=1 Tax=Lacticaseibacillus mingshuiensis TaxID=2799574 RepID=UPI0019511179|nr:dihydrofolate reductase family protein [Lacticaseibacillus mingshuiensis]